MLTLNTNSGTYFTSTSQSTMDVGVAVNGVVSAIKSVGAYGWSYATAELVWTHTFSAGDVLTPYVGFGGANLISAIGSGWNPLYTNPTTAAASSQWSVVSLSSGTAQPAANVQASGAVSTSLPLAQLQGTGNLDNIVAAWPTVLADTFNGVSASSLVSGFYTGYSPASGTYVVPARGTYLLVAQVSVQVSSGIQPSVWYVNLFVNGVWTAQQACLQTVQSTPLSCAYVGVQTLPANALVNFGVAFSGAAAAAAWTIANTTTNNFLNILMMP
jgi:hypothetical protein